MRLGRSRDIPHYFLAALSICAIGACAPRYTSRAVVVRVDPGASQVTLSHDAIPGFMESMVMPFDVRDRALLRGLAPGDRVAFRLRVHRGRSIVDRLRVTSAVRVDAGALRSPAAPILVALGAPVPDFELINQDGERLTLSSLRRHVVAVTFVYTRCPLPDYCPRMMTNFRALAQRFGDRLGRDLTLLTITFDPTFDSPVVLKRYAASFGAGRAGWQLLTGSREEVRQVCERFGLEFWPEDGLITHTLQTAIIDRDGRLAASVEGKDYTPRQLGDLIEATLIAKR